LGANQQPVAVTGTRRGVSIQGMGGIGKSVLAAAISRDEDVRQAFPDGVFWVSLGQEPNVLSLQTELARELGEETPAFSAVTGGKKNLRELLTARCCFIVLDDIWQEQHLRAFDVLGDHCQMLITTRDSGLVTGIGAVEHSLDLLSLAQASVLLARWTGCEITELPPQADEIARECGYLPLALSMAGAMLKKNRRWDSVLQRLQRADLDKIRQQFPDYEYPDLLKMLQVSVDALESELQKRYLDFAVFPENARIPEGVLQTLWAPEGLDELDVADVLDELVAKSLLRRDEQENLFLHDLQYDYIIKQVEDLPALHQRWLDAYSAVCNEEWASGPKDGYFFGQLARHLKAAGQIDELRMLLLDYDWLETKLSVNSIYGLLTDYDLLSDEVNICLVQAALRLSIHVLVNHPEQLAERLWGHLMDKNKVELQLLLTEAAAKKRTSWLRPNRSNLIDITGQLVSTFMAFDWASCVAITPDCQFALCTFSSDLKLWSLEKGKVVRSFSSHSALVHSVAIVADGKRAISASADQTLKLWNLETGKVIHTFLGHKESVYSVAITPDNKHAISASADQTLKLWDLETGMLLKTHTHHFKNNEVTCCVVITPDGKYVISKCEDQILELWNLTTGETLRKFSEHIDAITSVSITPDGKHIVSASFDRTLKLWNLETGKVRRTFLGHSDAITSVSITPDGKHIVSASFDRTLKLWNLETGENLQTFLGHSDAVLSVVVTPNGKRILSSSEDRTLRLWDLQLEHRLSVPSANLSSVCSVAISTDGRLAVSCNSNRTLKQWDVGTGQPSYMYSGHNFDFFHAIAMSADGKYAACNYFKTLEIWDLDAGVRLKTLLGHNYLVFSVAVSSNGKYALSGSTDLKLWDLKSGDELCTLLGHKDVISSVAISADCKRAFSSSFDQTLKIWDLEIGQELNSIPIDHTTCVSMSADGQLGLSGKYLKLWNLQSGELLRNHLADGGNVTSVAMTPDGNFAVSCGSDNTLRLWNLLTGKCLATFIGDYPLETCAITSDGKTIMTGDRVGNVHFFSFIQSKE